jgi:hypothetical protein
VKRFPRSRHYSIVSQTRGSGVSPGLNLYEPVFSRVKIPREEPYRRGEGWGDSGDWSLKTTQAPSPFGSLMLIVSFAFGEIHRRNLASELL